MRSILVCVLLFSSLSVAYSLGSDLSLTVSQTNAGVPGSSLDMASDNGSGEIVSDNGELVGGIVAFVNDTPITLYDLRNLQESGLDRQVALDQLVSERLLNDEIVRLKMQVDDMELERIISEIASNNKVSLVDFYRNLLASGVKMDEYRAKLRDQVQMQRLLAHIVANSQNGSELAIRKYYEENPEEFNIPKSVTVRRYVATNRDDLQAIIDKYNGHTETPPELNIPSEDETIVLSTINEDLSDVFIKAKVYSFTPILTLQGGFILFWISAKNDIEHIGIGKARDYILQKIAHNERGKILDDYLSYLRARSKIVFIKNGF